MNTPRIKTNHQKGEVYPNVWSDFAWARENRDTLLAQYGESVVLIYEKQVIGVGQTLHEAEDMAERNLPPQQGQITPITFMLYHRHPVLRVQTAIIDNE